MHQKKITTKCTLLILPFQISWVRQMCSFSLDNIGPLSGKLALYTIYEAIVIQFISMANHSLCPVPKVECIPWNSGPMKVYILSSEKCLYKLHYTRMCIKQLVEVCSLHCHSTLILCYFNTNFFPSTNVYQYCIFMSTDTSDQVTLSDFL